MRGAGSYLNCLNPKLKSCILEKDPFLFRMGSILKERQQLRERRLMGFELA